MFDLRGKKAIVTGGNKGLGFGMSQGLCEGGASVVIIGSSDETERAAQSLRDTGFDAHAVVCDLSDKVDLERGFAQALKMHGGRLDILVNNAGVQRRAKAEEFEWDDWQFVLSVNLDAVFLLCQLAGRVMLAQGKGKIINIASMLSYFGGITVPAYAASKGGVAQLTKALSNEWAGRGVCVNAIAPGYMDTEMNVNLINDEKRYTDITARIPAGRWGTAEDMKGVVVFLASEASDYLNGAIIPVDGGYLAK
ncbi:MAG: SDR family oxidoreductase [Sphaerochaeta sp.]|jgi:2-deoxy-D-gluconate 3-dehydrogenase